MFNNVHYKKANYEILTDTEFANIDDYMVLYNGFNIQNGMITFDLNSKKIIDNLKERYKFITYRFKYKNFSKFFSEEELLNEEDYLLTKYAFISVDLNNRNFKQRIPIGTSIYLNNSDEKFLLNNYILSINFDDIYESSFDLPSDSFIDLSSDNGNIIHYMSETETLLFNGKEKYLNIKEVIESGLLRYYETYTYTFLDKTYELKNVLVFHNKVIGCIEVINKCFINENMMPCVTIHGMDINLSYGIQSVLKEYEDLLYYENIDQILGSVSFNEYHDGDFIFFKDKNDIFIVKKDGFKKINIKDIVYDIDPPLDTSLGKLWFDFTTGILYCYNGNIWKPLNPPSLKNLSILWNNDKKLGLDNDKNFLEVFAYNERAFNSYLNLY